MEEEEPPPPPVRPQPPASLLDKVVKPVVPLPRVAGGQRWYDATLTDWPENDFRIFVGNLGTEVTDDILSKAFSKYTSFYRARIVRDKYANKSRGYVFAMDTLQGNVSFDRYGFVSLLDMADGVRALKEMDGRYIGNRPCKLSKSTWEDRVDEKRLKQITKIKKNKKHVG